jgi:tRNA A37 threonylcarbamoyladenosine synthetase subunit TsaC/SUA5/YrdC
MEPFIHDYLNALSVLERPDGVIAFPTDTVYGLGCQVMHAGAIARIYRIKGRDEQKPLVLLGYEQQSFVPYVADLPAAAYQPGYGHRCLACARLQGAARTAQACSGRCPCHHQR